MKKVLIVFLCMFFVNCSFTPPKNCSTRTRYPLFKQCYKNWANNKLGRDSTICNLGCVMSAIAIALKGNGKYIDGREADPSVLNEYFLIYCC